MGCCWCIACFPTFLRVPNTLYPAIRDYLSRSRNKLEPRPSDWPADQVWLGRKPGTYQWYELQDSVEYYQDFDGPKICWPEIAKLPRFSWDDSSYYTNNKVYIIPRASASLLALLQSRVLWYATANICQPLRLRGGLWQYQTFSQFISRLPIPGLEKHDEDRLSNLAIRITELARTRYELHRKTRHRILSDLGVPGKPLNQKLTAWWELDFPAFRTELGKAFKKDIPLKDRDDWEALLAARKAEHQRLTREIVDGEGELNERVYRLFDLTPEEIRIIEETTKYPYGEV